MAYTIPFQFAPVGKPEIFAPGTKDTNLGQTKIPITSNVYIPSCLDQTSTVKSNHRAVSDNYVERFGTPISYWSTGYDLDEHNPIYGEHPTAKYRGPRAMKAVVNLQSYSTMLTKFGIMSELDIIIYIPILAFERVWGKVIPLNGDLFLITDSSCDRPLGQTPMVFEVTEKHDSVNPTDFMGGHFVWKLVGKRMDNSYEPNAPQEKGIGGPVDSGSYGKIESSIEDTLITNPDGKDDVNDAARADFDNQNDSIYGRYL